MAPILYDMGVGIFIRQLKSLREILEKGESWLKEKDLPEETLIESRLAPDMFPLKFQVQTCCDDSAKLLNRMIDAKIEVPLRDEKTFAELYARIERALSWLEGVKPEAFEGKEGKDIRFMSGPAEVRFDGWTYLQEIALPNCKLCLHTLSCALADNASFVP